MSATDTFESFTASLTEQERKQLAAFIKTGKSDLLAARSEDARLRILNQFIAEAHRLLRQSKR